MGAMADWDPVLISTLNLMLDAGFPMFLTWGPDLRLFYNDAYEPVLAGKVVELGQPMHQVFPEAWDEVGPLFDKAMAGRPTFLEDYHVPLVQDGALGSTWWSFSYSPIQTQDGQVGGVLGIVYETTRRLRSAETLRASEAALRTVADTASGLLWRCDPGGRMTWINQRMEDYLGGPTLGEAHWDDRVHPDDISEAERAHAACATDGSSFEVQQRLLGGDGRYRWFLIRGQQVVDAQGAVIEWCGSAADIEDWRAAAEGLDQRDQLLRDFHGAEATFLWVADIATRQLEPTNPEVRAAWGLTGEGAIRWEDWTDTIHPDDRAAFAAAFDQAAIGHSTQIRFRRLSSVGSARTCQLTAFPLGGKREKIGGLVVELGGEDDPRVYLVNDQGGDEQDLSRALKARGFRVRVFNGVKDFERLCGDLRPGAVVVSVGADAGPALKTAAALKAAPHLGWLAIGDFEARLNDVVGLMKLGALNVLSRPAAEDVVLACQAAFDLKAPQRPGPTAGLTARLAQLSGREREVLRGLIAGGTNKTIAQDLSLSPRTVETHRAHLMSRLEVSTLADLIRVATEVGFEA